MSNEQDLGTTEEQLMMLKGMTEHFGTIHEAQLLQLRMWGLFYIPHSKATEVRINGEDMIVDFYPKIQDDPPGNIKDCYHSLTQSVKWLLGDKWMVRVRINDKWVYRQR